MLCDAGEFLDVTLDGEVFEVEQEGFGICIACPRDTYQPENATDTPNCIECPPEAPRNLITGSTSASDCVYGSLIYKIYNVHIFFMRSFLCKQVLAVGASSTIQKIQHNASNAT